MAKPPSFIGTWRMDRMEDWDQDFVDAEVKAYIRFDPDGYGEFQFGYVWGQMACEYTQRDGKPAVEWSWEGNDEMDPASGRGWAVFGDGGTLQGRLYFQSNDYFEFTATRKARSKGSRAAGRSLHIIWPPKARKTVKVKSKQRKR